MSNISLSPRQHVLEEEIQNLLASAQDPVSLDMFKNPVSLVPCGHSLSYETANMMYKLTGDLQVRNPGSCPLCCTDVAQCIPNHSLRQLVEGLISKVEASAATVLPCVTRRIALEERPVVPFPGKGARFECRKPWRDTSWGACKEMELVSVTPLSFLSKVSVCGRSDGSVEIWIHGGRTTEAIFQDMDRFSKFISDSGFQLEESSFFYRAQCSVAHMWVLKVLADHNEVSDKEFQFMKRLAEVQDWRAVEQEMGVSSSSSSFPIPSRGLSSVASFSTNRMFLTAVTPFLLH